LKVKRGEGMKYASVKRDTRLNHRIIDLRTEANQAIFQIESGVGQLFREFLYSNQFMDIHTPKLLDGASEGGAEVFRLPYFSANKIATLAQSPQLHKQMAICSDMERVFEIGPVFRAEKTFSHRHLTEFIGLDVEMTINEHYHEVLELLDQLFFYMFEGLKKRFTKQMNIVSQQFPFQPIEYKYPCPRLLYSEAVAMLRQHGVQMEQYADLKTKDEKILGELVKEKYGADFFILDKFPQEVRPFYSMPSAENENYANAFDLFLRGEEICSGSQRVHEPTLLEERMKKCNVDPETISYYLDAFKYGAPPHAGAGIGLARVVMLFLGLSNIRYTSMFPRDPIRLSP